MATNDETDIKVSVRDLRKRFESSDVACHQKSTLESKEQQQPKKSLPKQNEPTSVLSKSQFTDERDETRKGINIASKLPPLLSQTQDVNSQVKSQEQDKVHIQYGQEYAADKTEDSVSQESSAHGKPKKRRPRHKKVPSESKEPDGNAQGDLERSAVSGPDGSVQVKPKDKGPRPKKIPKKPSNLTVPGDNVWVINFIKLILHSGGGAMAVTDVENWVHGECEKKRWNKPSVQKLVKQYIGKYFEVDDPKVRQANVSVVTGAVVCENARCSNGLCPNVHICKYYLSDSCNNDKCKFSHDFKEPHNAKILHQHSLDILTKEDLKILFKLKCSRKIIPNDGALPHTKTSNPTICTFYNAKGCTKSQVCEHMHVCIHFIQGSCKFGETCKRSHNIYDPQPKAVLEKSGWNIEEESKIVLQTLRKCLCPKPKPEQKPGSKPQTVIAPGRTKQRKPKICYHYNLDSGCNNGDNCLRIHICDYYVKGNCRDGDSCSKTHAILDPQPRQVLQNLGWDVTKDSKSILEDIRQAIYSASSTTSVGGIKDSAITADTLICNFFLIKDGCLFKESCQKVHTKKPYMWQYSQEYGMPRKEIWERFPEDDNDSIELMFEDVNNDNCVANRKAGDIAKINFDDMTYEVSAGKIGKVRRIGTPSWGDAALTKPFVTKWQWYWKDEYGKWIMYGKKEGSHDISDISSRDIEEKKVQGDEMFEFTVDPNTYKINLKEMYQINVKFGTKRKIRRRPEFLGTKPAAAPSTVSSHDFPSHWQDVRVESGYQEIEIQNGGLTREEYKKIEALFLQTMPNFQVRSIKRIQSYELWEDFDRKRKRLQKISPKASEEKFLFHGTQEKYLGAICKQGFDWRITGLSVGTMYGKGSYFARDASYSRNYTDCNKLLVVRVLVGEYAKGIPDMVRPPPKDPSKPLENLYESCVDNINNPKIFVVFSSDQSYPEYVIQYDRR